MLLVKSYAVSLPFTALCAAIKPREIFESAASRHFQKFLAPL